MPSTMPLINNFNSGELSPLLDGRTDLKKYFSGCRILKNFIATPYGGAERRPGTYYVAETKDSSKESRLVSFEYNIEQAYQLEVGDQYIRFYKNGGQVVYTRISFGANPSGDFAVGATMAGATSGATAIVVEKISTQVYDIKYELGTWTDGEIINCGDKNVDCAEGYPTTAASSNPVEISSPFLEADLFDLHFLQSADVLYIVDNEGGYQPRKLSRLSHDHWSLEAIDFEWGPFLDLNTTANTLTAIALVDVTSGETFAASSAVVNGAASEAFDDVVDGVNGWEADTGNVTNEWISCQFAASKTVTKIKIQNLESLLNITDGVRHCKLEGSNAADLKTIKNVAIEDLGGSPNEVRITTTAAHGFSQDDTVTIIGTTNYDGTYTITNVAAADTFDIESAHTAETPAGTESAQVWTKISADDWIQNCSVYNTDEIELDKVSDYDTWAEIDFNNSTAYTYYRLFCYDNWGGSALSIKEIEMFELGLTLVSVDDIFTSDHVGSIWKLAYPRTDNAYNGVCDAVGEIGSAIRLKNTCRFRTVNDGTSADKYVIKRKYDNDSGYHYFKSLRGGVNYDLSWDEPVKVGADYIVELLAESADDDVEFTLSCEHSYDVCYVKIHAVTDANNAEVSLIKGDSPPATATKLWAEGAWSDERGWPRTIGFFEGRVVYAGNTYNPLTLWFSETKNFEGMWGKTLAENENLDDDALIFTISAAQQNMIKWILGQDALLVGTAGSEGKLTSHNRNLPLTPTNIPDYRPQSSYGSSSIQPLLINDVVVFPQRENKKIREFKYSFDDDLFVARDLTMFAEHITEGGITSIAHQKQPDSILWAIRSDGTLLGMIYERLEEIYGWFRVVTDGSFESVSVISSAGQTTSEDEVWVIVNRTIGAATKRYVEYFKPRDWGDTDTDVFFVDSGLSSAGSGENTYIGGLDHLEGETVDILIDGKVGDQQVVGTGKSNTTGYVDLKIGGTGTASTTKLHVGLNYESDLEPMKLEIPMGDAGTSRGRIKRIHEAVISFDNTLGGFYGRDSDNLDELDHSVTGTSGSMTPLKTQEEPVSWPGLDETDGDIFIQQTYPLPMTVRAIIPKLDISEL